MLHEIKNTFENTEARRPDEKEEEIILNCDVLYMVRTKNVGVCLPPLNVRTNPNLLPSSAVLSQA